MSGINDLPADDLWPIIFRNLSIKELLTCRLINKKFKKFSDNTDGIKKLIIRQPDFYNEDEDLYWHYNNTLIKDEDTISLKFFRSIKLLSIFNLDKYLKYLKIYDDEFELEELSNLINLKYLEFGCYCAYNQQINSNNLKAIACSNSKLSIKLNKPKLKKIQFNNMYGIKLNGNPESIKHLVTSDCVNELEIFKNLEIIELRDIYIYENLNENLLIIFKCLKQLKINLDSGSNYSDERIKNSLIKVLNDKIKLERELEIYLEGVKIENIDKFNELKATEDPYWKFRLNNYDLLDLNLPFIKYLNYEDLEECVNNIKIDLPLSFFDKFFNINHVFVNERINDIVGFNWFLNNSKYLTKLIISCKSLLDELFFNNLPTSIRYLSIENRFKIENRLDINYDFILKLSNLVWFETDIDKDLFDLAFTSFLNFKYLNRFVFNYKKKKISIHKVKYYFILNNRMKYRLDYNQLVEKCNLIRSK